MLFGEKAPKTDQLYDVHYLHSHVITSLQPVRDN